LKDSVKALLQVTPMHKLIMEVLRNELSRRIEKNPSYSLRALARQLDISHTQLSLVMNGYRPPSKILLEKMLKTFSMNKKATALILGILETKRKDSSKSQQNFTKVSLEQYNLFSEWQHYAILSLLEIQDTKLTPEFISKRLGISLIQAKVSIQRLISLELIEEYKKGYWRQKGGPIVVENTHSTAATRNFQRQLITKALDSMDKDPIELRDLSSTTFSMDPKLVPHALQRIREFRRQLTAELETMSEAEEVYNITVQLFPSSRRSI